MSKKQFSDVNCRYGAPMGRPSHGDPEDEPAELFKVTPVDGDYDDGGAYWGFYGSPPLYCLRTSESENFTRADNWEGAFGIFEEQFPGLKLKQPVRRKRIQ